MPGKKRKRPRYWYELGKKWLRAREQGTVFIDFARTIPDYCEDTLRKKLKEFGFNLKPKKNV
jgi:hypothetical protein